MSGTYALIFIRLTVSLRIDDDDFTMTWDTFKFVFLNSHNLALWVIPLGLAVLLRIITHRYHHQLIFPLCTCPVAFDPVATLVYLSIYRLIPGRDRFHYYSGCILPCGGGGGVGFK